MGDILPGAGDSPRAAHAGRMELSTAAVGPRTVDEVWERYERPALWSTWSPQIRDVDAPERMAAGVRGRVHGLGGLGADFEVLDWDGDAHEWGWLVHGRLPLGVPGPTLTLRHGVAEIAGGTRAWLDVRGAAPWVAAYLAPARLALHRLVH
jgi:hypothetical protein